MPTLQGKYWTFTLNNYCQDDIDAYVAFGDERVGDELDAEYFLFSREFGESGTPHLQGYIAFPSRKTFNYVKALLTCSNIPHIERAKGSAAQNKEYIEKANPEGQQEKSEEDIFEFGTLPRNGRGRRTDLELAYEQIRAGTTFSALSESYPSASVRYGAGLQRLIMLHPKPKPLLEIHVFWGQTGTGKTRRCYDFTSLEKIWSCPGKQGTGVWFDGYDGHEVALFDDFDGSWFPVTTFLKLIDRYPFRYQVKGGFVPWIPKHLFITSNVDPKDWYGGASEAHQAAVMRKLREFGTILECTRENSPY
jgi:hypothetical protein